jgi:hypothetical protein
MEGVMLDKSANSSGDDLAIMVLMRFPFLIAAILFGSVNDGGH